MQVMDLFKSDLFPDFRLLAGDGGILHPVTGITVFDAPDIYKWLRGGELIIGNAYIFREDQEAFIAFLQRVRENGASAVGIKLDRFFGDVPQQVLAAADKVNLPLIFIPFSYRWADIIDLVHGAIQKKAPSPVLLEEKELLDVFSLPSRFVAVIAKEMKRPVAVRCPSLNLCSLVHPDKAPSSFPTEQEYFSAELCDEEGLPPRGNIRVSRENRCGAFRISSMVYKYDGPPFCEVHVILRPNENAPPLQSERLLVFLLNVIQANARASETKEPAPEETRSEFLQRLCLGNYSDQRIAEGKASALGIRFPEESFVALIHDSEPCPVLNGCDKGVLSFRMGSSLILIVPWAERENCIGKIAQFCSRKKIWSVFGRKCGALLNVADSYMDCRRSLAILKKTFLPPGAYAYEEAMLFSMLYKVKDTHEGRVLVDRYWRPVDEMPGNSRTVQPADVVAALIQNGFNAKKSAGALHVHYNSVRNYISEIQTATGLDFGKPMDTFLLTLCYLLVKEKEKRKSGIYAFRAGEGFSS